MNLAPTNWCITDNAGGEFTLEIPKMGGLFAGESAGLFYVKEDGNSSVRRMPYLATEYGWAKGKSALGPATINVSLPDLPSPLSGRIYRNPLKKGKLSRWDLSGTFVAVSVGGSLGHKVGGAQLQGGILFLGASHLFLGWITAVMGPLMQAVIAAECEGVVVLGGPALTTGIGAGVSGTVAQGTIL